MRKTKQTGVLFLDEIGDLHSEVQDKLLRVLEEQAFHPLGWSPIKELPKLVFATNKNISEDSTFKKDL